MHAVLGKHKATLQALLSQEGVRTDIYSGPLRHTVCGNVPIWGRDYVGVTADIV
jgi:hypothetical protein